MAKDSDKVSSNSTTEPPYGRVVSSKMYELKGNYRTGFDDLAAGFFSPCMQEAKLYRRATGYFSSHALLTWAEALPRLVQSNDLEVKLIASQELSPQDIITFKKLISDETRAEFRQMLVDRILNEIIILTENPNNEGARARVFAWLVANDRLQIRFAFAKHLEVAGIFHEKFGVFDFPAGEQVSFTGSANETLGGHKLNYESIDVFRSWVQGDKDRVEIKIDQFEDAWNNKAEGLEVEIPSEETVAKLRARAPKTFPGPSTSSERNDNEAQSRWRHQDEAVETFISKGAGVLEMATGTGKTRTALKIMSCLIERGELRSAIVTMDGTDLLDQWYDELIEWANEPGRRWLIYRHYERHTELGAFALAMEQSSTSALLVIGRGQLYKVIPRISQVHGQHMLIVHDEVHGLGAPAQVRALRGEHAKFRWRLGLSATPERIYDELGNQFINDEIGPKIYDFPLESAISRGILCEFKYIPLEYELTNGDKKRIQAAYAKKSVRAQEGNPMSNEEFWTELAKVYKTAEMKPKAFMEYLKRNTELLQNCIIFVETKEYGNQLLEGIHEYTPRYRTYYAEDDRNHLKEFADNNIDCLITCHRLSQGIDIKSLRAVVLFASARSKLESIQRIGRCLRVDPNAPNQRALVIDFVRSANEDDTIPNADQDRCAWLTALSKVRRSNDA